MIMTIFEKFILNEQNVNSGDHYFEHSNFLNIG